MQLSFRQGLVQYQSNFLQWENNNVIISTTNKPVIATVTHGNANYLIVEPKRQDPFIAWKDLPTDGSDIWIYWDIDIVSSEITYGYTTNQPVVSPTDIFAATIPFPTTPPTGQQWYSTTEHIMKDWGGYSWAPKIRVFAAKIENSGAVITPYPVGTQIGDATQIAAGRILRTGSGKPIKKSDKTFATSEDKFFVENSDVRISAFETDLVVGKALENMPEFSVVTLVNFDDYKLANYEDTNSRIVGMIVDPALYGESIFINIQGIITNPNWNWTVPNAKLWIGDNGQLTDTDPCTIDLTKPVQEPIARVVSPISVLFGQGLFNQAGTESTLLIPDASYTVEGITYLSLDPVAADHPIAVGDNDPRLTDARTPLPHTHPATQITTTAYGTLTGTNVQTNLQQLESSKLAKSGGTMTGSLNLYADPTSDLEAATKQYVDNHISPSVPQVNSDWLATSGPAEILNKPVIPTTLLPDNITQTIWIPAHAMIPHPTKSPSVNIFEVTRDDPSEISSIYTTLDFINTDVNVAVFQAVLPYSWNTEHVSVEVYWSHAVDDAGSVVWKVAAGTIEHGNQLKAVYGTHAEAVSSYTTGGDIIKTTTAPLFIKNNVSDNPQDPNTGRVLNLQIYRNTNDDRDTLGVAARIHGVKLVYGVKDITDEVIPVVDWIEMYRLIPDPVASDIYLGGDVVISGNGNVCVAVGNSAYVFERTATGWVERQVLPATGGGMLGINYDGSVFTVGNYTPDYLSVITNIYKRSGNTWAVDYTITDTSSAEVFPSISLWCGINSAGTKIVYLFGDRTTPSVWDVYIHTVTFDGTVWSKQTQLISSAENNLSVNTDLSNDGNVVVFAGNHAGSSPNGVTTYVWTGSNWALNPTVLWPESTYQNVSISGTGNRVVISPDGGLDPYPRMFRVYYNNGTSWVLEFEEIIPLEANGHYTKAKINAAGDKIVASNPYKPIDGINGVGEQYIYERVGSIWTKTATLITQQKHNWIEAGWSLDYDDSGTVVAVGSDCATVNGLTYVGAIFIFEKH